MEAFANQLPLSELQAHIMSDPDAGRGSVKEVTWGYRASRMSDEVRKAHIHRGYFDILTFNEVCRDVERRINAGKHDGVERRCGLPFFLGVVMSLVWYSVFTSFQSHICRFPNYVKGG